MNTGISLIDKCFDERYKFVITYNHENKMWNARTYRIIDEELIAHTITKADLKDSLSCLYLSLNK